MGSSNGKKGPPRGAPPPPLLEPESFWPGDEEAPLDMDHDDMEEENTQPFVVKPPSTSAAVEDDDDLATVGLDDFIPARRSRSLPPRKPMPPRPKRIEKPIAAFNPPTENIQENDEVVLIEEAMDLKKALMYLGAVAVLFGFLGWFLIGRHAGQDSSESPEVLDNQKPQKTSKALPKKESLASTAPTLKQTPSLESKRGAEEKKSPAMVQNKKVFIEVISDPPGAEVFVDGEKTGIAPTSIKGVESQQVRLRLYLPGYKPWEKVLDLEGKIPKEMNISLEKKNSCTNGTGFISVSSNPSGASIDLDGDKVPVKTPTVINDVCAGQPIHLTLRKPRYSPWKKTLTVNKGDILSVKADLTHK